MFFARPFQLLLSACTASLWRLVENFSHHLPVSDLPLELRRTHGEWVYILGSYLTSVLYPARISKVAVVLCGDDARIHALVPFATSSPLALKETFVGARNLSNHAKASSTPLFANLKIFDVFSIYSVQISFFMYLYHNGALPISLTQIFHTGNQIHQYSTKYSDVYRPQTCRTIIKKNSILFQGPRIWKSLPNNIKSASTFNTSKRVIKPFLRVIFILFIVFFILLVIYSEWQNNKIKIKWNARTIIRQGGRIKRQKICNVEPKMVMKILH